MSLSWGFVGYATFRLISLPLTACSAATAVTLSTPHATTYNVSVSKLLPVVRLSFVASPSSLASAVHPSLIPRRRRRRPRTPCTHPLRATHSRPQPLSLSFSFMIAWQVFCTVIGLFTSHTCPSLASKTSRAKLRARDAHRTHHPSSLLHSPPHGLSYRSILHKSSTVPFRQRKADWSQQVPSLHRHCKQQDNVIKGTC